MSDALLGRYDSLQYTDEEVNEAISRRLNLDDCPDVRADLERLPRESAAYLQSRHHAENTIVSDKFSKKLEERGLFERWADEVVLPNTIPVSKPGWHDAEIAWMDKHAPDLVPELKAHRQWRRERKLEWATLWEVQQARTKNETGDATDDITGDKTDSK